MEGFIVKILVIFTGGTISSTENAGYVSPDSSKQYKLLDLYKKRVKENQSNKAIEFDTLSPYQILSENITCDNFRMLAECLNMVDKSLYNGIIITHGTDTLQYTAAFTGYIMASSKIPIVFVSANYVLDDARSNGVDNFYYAVEFIRQNKGIGVFISYRNTGDYPKIHRATRVIMHQAYSDDVYSIRNSYYGYFDDCKFNYNTQIPVFGKSQTDIFNIPSGNGSSCSGILVIHPYPGMEYVMPSDNVKAILHYTYHSGTLCSKSPSFLQFAEYTKAKNIPVFITGAGIGADYESVKCYKEYGFYVLPAASPEAMYMKLWLCVINNKDTNEIVKVMNKPLADDILLY